MRRSLTYRILTRTAAVTTIGLLAITLISIQVSFIVWAPSRFFAGLQYGRFGWGEHGKEHGEFSLHVNVVERDFDWRATPRPPTAPPQVVNRVVPGSRTVNLAFFLVGNWNRWIPLWWFLAPAAGAWLALAIFDRRHKPGCCAECGYDLKGVPAGQDGVKCPECGTVCPPRSRLVELRSQSALSGIDG